MQVKAINVLCTALDDMDKVEVVGIDNMRRMVRAADNLIAVIKAMQDTEQQKEAESNADKANLPG